MIDFHIATQDDIPELVKLVNSAYRGDYSFQGWTTEALILDGQRTDYLMLQDIIKTPNNQILLLRISGVLSGSVHLIFEVDSLYFGMLTIDPKIQAQGLGKVLLSEIEKRAIISGKYRIRISVIHTRSELISYYERRGFKATGKWEDFPENDPRYGLPKVQGLKLLEFEKVLNHF